MTIDTVLNVEIRMKASRLLVTVVATTLAGCASVGLSRNIAASDGPLSKEEIQRCLDVGHKVGNRIYSPVPEAGRVFKPGYNFLVKDSNGSKGFGHQEASQGRVTIRYPAQGTVFVFDVVRRNGVVYFGNDATSCP